MTDRPDREPAPRTTAQPASPPGAPPSQPDDRDANRAALTRYLVDNHDRFTVDALERAAAAAGHNTDDIRAASARAREITASVPEPGRYANTARWIVLALYVATFLLFVIGSDMSARTYGVGVPILAATLAIVGGIALLRIDRSKVVSRDPLAAYASLLAAPFVLLVIVAGLCIGTTSPSFFSGSSAPGPTPAPEEVQPDAPAEPAPPESAPVEPAP